MKKLSERQLTFFISTLVITVFSCLMFGSFYHDYNFILEVNKSYSTIVKGIITSKWRRNINIYEYTASFNHIDFKKYDVISRANYGNAYQVGDTVLVRYNPINPKESVIFIKQEMESFYMPLYLFVISSLIQVNVLLTDVTQN